MLTPSVSLPRWLGPALLVAACAVVSIPERGEAAIIERIVAVIGDHAILLSELRERARPFLVRIYQETPSGAQRNAAISQIYREVLDRMIDEQIENRAANRANIAVTTQEVDAAIERIAGQNGLSVEELVSEAIRSGMSEQEYRREVRRQVLDAKLMNLRVQGRIRVTEDDLREEYRQAVADERKRQKYRIAWIHVPPTEGKNAQRDLALRIVRQARTGADFGGLARKHSSDTRTRKGGGLLPEMKPGRLPPEMEQVVQSLEVGEVSAPVRMGDQLVVIRLVEREESTLPTFEEARAELENRVYVRKMDQARRRWLDGLRRQAHVVVRL
ncbi:MAG: peptidylprolyl isomerase [Polyangiaceae bacterium]|nr:peptidylprolyl isomerase [Polyangiaceae bacterium]